MIIADAFFPAIPNCANCISECANCILLQEYQSVFPAFSQKKDRGKPPEVPDPIQAGNHPDFLSLFRLMILFFFCSGLFYILFLLPALAAIRRIRITAAAIPAA